LGAYVSYSLPVFDGPTPTREQLKGLSLQIGIGPMWDFDAQPQVPAKLMGAQLDPSRTVAAYEKKKKSLRSKVTDTARQKVLKSTSPDWIATYGSFYQMKADTSFVKMKRVRGSAVFDGEKVDAFDWKFKTGFTGFDGDTLVGHVDGQIVGTRKSP
jgi:hypothetical protein